MGLRPGSDEPYRCLEEDADQNRERAQDARIKGLPAESWSLLLRLAAGGGCWVSVGGGSCKQKRYGGRHDIK